MLRIMARYTPALAAIGLTAFAATALAAPAAKPAPPEADRPNILFLLVDDQRDDTLGCAGHPIIKTPNVDRLAAEGVRFRNMFVTTSICWVSRASIFTGLHELTHGYRFARKKVDQSHAAASYPALLRQSGYRTGFLGKFHVSVPAEIQRTWFDVFRTLNRHPYFKKQPDGTRRHITRINADRAVEFIEQQPADQPFLLSVCFSAAHAEDSDRRPGIGHFPWPKTVDGMYDDIDIPPPRLNDPAIFEGQPEFLKKSLNRVRYFWRWDTPEKYQTNMRAYFRMISGIDHAIGRMIRALDEQGLAENTIVVYAADNGYYMGDRGFAGKWSHYEQSLRVPLVVYDPRLPESRRGRVVDQMALNIDLPATFLDWADVPIPDHYQGRSLRPLVDGDESVEWRDDFFCEHRVNIPSIPKWEGVRDRRYVYARYFEQEPPYEFLHDLKTDPDQLRNFVDDPEYTDVLARMRARCDELRGRYTPR